MKYQDINSKTIDLWCKDGWEWGKPVEHETFMAAVNGEWGVYLTPTKIVPREWFGELKGKRILGLASGGGQQIPIFTALGAECTVLDYSECQCESEKMVAEREGYTVEIIQGDMTERLPFEDETFDLIFHPVSNCYVEDVKHVFEECYRVLKTGGVLLGGFDNGMNYIFDATGSVLKNKLPFNPLKNKRLYDECISMNMGIQFSHTLEDQIGSQLEVGFRLTHVYEDTNGYGKLHDYHVPSFWATRAVK